MNRRDFFRRSALLSAGIVAANQLELIDRLTWKRSLFPGATFTKRNGLYIATSNPNVDLAVSIMYADESEDRPGELPRVGAYSMRGAGRLDLPAAPAGVHRRIIHIGKLEPGHELRQISVVLNGQVMLVQHAVPNAAMHINLMDGIQQS